MTNHTDTQTHSVFFIHTLYTLLFGVFVCFTLTCIVSSEGCVCECENDTGLVCDTKKCESYIHPEAPFSAKSYIRRHRCSRLRVCSGRCSSWKKTKQKEYSFLLHHGIFINSCNKCDAIAHSKRKWIIVGVQRTTGSNKRAQSCVNTMPDPKSYNQAESKT